MPASFASSARFSNELLRTEFNQEVAVVKPHLQPIITTVPMGDNEGVEQAFIVTGNESEPHELFTGQVEKFDKIGEYVFRIRPVEHGGGLQVHDNELSDEKIQATMQHAARLGRKAQQYIEKQLVQDVVESATAVDGFDGQPLYSASHTWSTSDDATLGDPAPTSTGTQSNIYSAARAADYSSTTQIYDDFFAAVAQMNGWVDDKGTKMATGSDDEEFIILYNNQNAALMRYMKLAWDPSSLPGDSTNRDGLQKNVTLVSSSHLDATGGTTDNDWYLFRVGPGMAKPLVLQERRIVSTESWRDPKTRMNFWQYVFRFGMSWNAWWTTIKVDNA